MLPGVHLDHPDAGNDLVHDTHTLVCHSCRLKPEMREEWIERVRKNDKEGGGEGNGSGWGE